MSKYKNVIAKGLFIVIAVVLWEIYTRVSGNRMLPSAGQIFTALIKDTASGELGTHFIYSMQLITAGISIGVILAGLLTALYMISSIAAAVLDIIISIMHPLPGIALLPIIMLIFGLGPQSIIVIIIHSILWPIMVNALSGFKSIPKTQLELGRNIGMNELRLVLSVMIPNAFPNILAGLKIAWSRSWRALVAAEMVFGATGMNGGIGWFIYKKRYLMEVPSVFGGLIVIIIVGIVIDDILFHLVERKTIVKWGMSK